MDANTVTVSIAGRQVEMTRPTSDQLIAVSMAKSDHLPVMTKIDIMTTVFLSLLPDDDTRAWFTLQMASSNATFEDIAVTIQQVATVQQDRKPAKKTAARKR